MIRISVIGRLGQDATVNNVNGKTVINFSMAYSEKFKNQQGEDVDKTTWVSCAYWTDKTNVSNYLKKGTAGFFPDFCLRNSILKVKLDIYKCPFFKSG